MTRKQLAVLGAVVLIALAVVGIGYGLWFEVLQIDGTINTSELDVGIIDYDVEECFEVYHNGEWVDRVCTGDPLFELKDEMTECAVMPIEPNTYDENPEPNTNAPDDGWDGLSVVVNEAYPNFWCRVDFTVENSAEVPVHLTAPIYNGPMFHPEEEGVVLVAGCFNEGMIAPPLDYSPGEPEDGMVGRPIEGAPPGTDCNDVALAKSAFTGGNISLIPGPDPLVDDDYYEISLTRDPNVAPYCEFLVGLATYEKVLNSGNVPGDPEVTINEDSYSTQWLYDFAEEWMGPNAGTMVLTADAPMDEGGPCSTQVDSYVGPTLLGIGDRDIPNLTEWYGNRKFDHQHDNYSNRCDPRWQLHKGEQVRCAILIGFTNDTTADGEPIGENEQYTFDYIIPAWQWNEDDAAAMQLLPPPSP